MTGVRRHRSLGLGVPGGGGVGHGGGGAVRQWARERGRVRGHVPWLGVPSVGQLSDGLGEGTGVHGGRAQGSEDGGECVGQLRVRAVNAVGQDLSEKTHP